MYLTAPPSSRRLPRPRRRCQARPSSARSCRPRGRRRCRGSTNSFCLAGRVNRAKKERKKTGNAREGGIVSCGSQISFCTTLGTGLSACKILFATAAVPAARATPGQQPTGEVSSGALSPARTPACPPAARWSPALSTRAPALDLVPFCPPQRRANPHRRCLWGWAFSRARSSASARLHRARRRHPRRPRPSCPRRRRPTHPRRPHPSRRHRPHRSRPPLPRPFRRRRLRPFRPPLPRPFRRRRHRPMTAARPTH